MKKKVQVWIYAKRESSPARFLVLKTCAKRGDFWQPVTGGVEPGEELAHAAFREATEETGLSFRNPPEPLNAPFQFESRGLIFEEHPFALEALAADRVTLDPREHESYQWVSAEEAFQMLRFPSNGDMLRILLKRLGH